MQVSLDRLLLEEKRSRIREQSDYTHNKNHMCNNELITWLTKKYLS